MRDIENLKIVVIGGGVMGTGVAQLFAEYGYQVRLVDKSQQALDIAKQNIQRSLRFVALSKSRPLQWEADVILDRIKMATDLQIPTATTLVVENITENYLQKRELYQQLGMLHELNCPVCVNTSAIPIVKLARFLPNPGRVLGVHFMNPVPEMPMVELIRSTMTTQQTLDKVEGLLADMGRQSVVVNDSPGFVTNRAMMLFVNEAIQMLQEKIASVEQIDQLFRQCFGHKMGPLQTADLIGLDTVLYSLEVICDELNDTRYRPCWLLKKMVYSGKHGMKSGQGFYEYV